MAELQSFLKDNVLRLLEVDSYSMQICVDALDEAGQEAAIDLVQDFQWMISNLNPKNARGSLNICFSCRHYPILASYYRLYIDIETENAHDRDIVQYVNLEFQREHPENRGKTQKLEQKIVKKANGVFQWVVLIVRIILSHLRDGKNLAAAFKKLESVPAELDDLYYQILQSKYGEDRPQCLLLFQWVCFARRRLSLSELRFAMVVDLDTSNGSIRKCQDSDYFAESDEDLRRLLRTLSGGLVEVSMLDRICYLQFIHQSVYDYLLRKGLNVLDSTPKTSVVGSAHFRLSRVCIKYMIMEEISLLSSDAIGSQVSWKQFPLLQYAVTSWIWHLEKLEEEGYTQNDLSKSFLISLNKMVQQLDPTRRTFTESEPVGTLLHLASMYNLLSVVNAIVEQNVIETNSKDLCGRTPLSLAAERGHRKVIELLLSKDAEPDFKDNNGRTPLAWAAQNGRQEVVELLLSKGAEPDFKDINGRTPLLWTAQYGRQKVVELLLSEGAKPDSKDNRGWTPLLWAARFGWQDVVELLLSKGAELDSKDDRGRTPLSMAVERGHKKVIELLLSEGAELDLKDGWGRTPLSVAVDCMQQEVVELLLSESAEPDSKDDHGQTPLSMAAQCGCHSVVQLLLSKGAKPDSKDKHGHTPLGWARIFRHTQVEKLLESAILSQTHPEQSQNSIPS